MKQFLAAAATILAATCSAGTAQATVTYHFQQSAAALDTRFGLFPGGTGPVSFDFTVANPSRT